MDTALLSNESAASEMRLELLSLALSIDDLVGPLNAVAQRTVSLCCNKYRLAVFGRFFNIATSLAYLFFYTKL